MVTVGTGSLEPRTPVTVRMNLATPVPEGDSLPWPIALDTVFGRSVPLVGLLAVLSIIALAIGFLWERRSREEEPQFPVMYEPPAGIGPAQTAYIISERVPGNAFIATLLYQAEQGLTRLDNAGDDQWTVTGTGTSKRWMATDDVTRALGEQLALTSPGGVFNVDGTVPSGLALKSAKTTLDATTKLWAKDAGALTSHGFEYLGRGLVYLALILAFLGFFFLPASIFGLPFAAFAFGGIGLLLTGVGTRRTETGRELWSRAGGFERLLSTNSSKDRLDFSARHDLYTSFIPFAVGFDVADEWAQKYRLSMHEEPPSPTWYVPAYAGGAAFSFASPGAFSGFESSLSSSIGAYEATQSSSSGGGGGGGGGGGSW